MSDPLTQAEWKEIEGYLLERPQCTTDEGGAIWIKQSNHGLSCVHPRTFLDIMREEANSLGARAAETNRILDENFKNECDSFVESFEPLTSDDIRGFKNAGIPFMSEAGFEALKKQLRGC